MDSVCEPFDRYHLGMKSATMETFSCADSARITPEVVEGYRPVRDVMSRLSRS